MTDTARNIVFWILLAVYAIAFLLLYNGFRKEEDASAKSKRIHAMAYDAVFIAIIALMGFVPSVGYISVVPGVISLTLIHIPVLLGAYLFGAKHGALYGFAFGITSWIQATLSPAGLNFFFIYPWISVLPRVLFGFLSGLLFDTLKKSPRIYRNPLVVGVCAFALTALHTALVFGALFAFYSADLLALINGFGSMVVLGLAMGFMAIILAGAFGEALLAGAIIPALGRGVALVGKKRDY